jgi:hypothetical protein
MTLFQIEELTSYWVQHPPLYMLAAAYFGFGKDNDALLQSKSMVGGREPHTDLNSVLADLGPGFSAGDVHAGLSPAILDFGELCRRAAVAG